MVFDIALIGILWLVALLTTGYSLFQLIRLRNLRERVASLTRSKPYETFEEQLKVVDEELNTSLFRRLVEKIVLPSVHRFSRFIPQTSGSIKVCEQLLAMAGKPMGLSGAEFMGIRVLFTILCAISGIAMMSLLAIWLPINDLATSLILCATTFSLFGFLAPLIWLRRVANQRRHKICRQLPDMLDLITLSIEAGLGFDSAIESATLRFEGPLSDELRGFMREVSLGKTRSQALRDLAERIKLEDISLLVASVHQAETLGVPIADSLKALAEELRKKRLRVIREQIAKLPIKLIFPLILFIFPTLFIAILGPAVIQLMRSGL